MRWEILSRSKLHAYMLSAFISSGHSYPAMHLTVQPVNQWSVHSGPLVLRAALLKSPAPTADKDRTVSRRSKPSSRTALMGEQPNPWDRIQPQDAMSRHRGAKPLRRCELSGGISLLSPEYLLAFEQRHFYAQTVGSLSSAFASARPVCLAVKLPYTFVLYARSQTALREPLETSVTVWEVTAPDKLPV